jgi:hypothetical protein
MRARVNAAPRCRGLEVLSADHCDTISEHLDIVNMVIAGARMNTSEAQKLGPNFSLLRRSNSLLAAREFTLIR